jgi:hypothetical protein
VSDPIFSIIGERRSGRRGFLNFQTPRFATCNLIIFIAYLMINEWKMGFGRTRPTPIISIVPLVKPSGAMSVNVMLATL